MSHENEEAHGASIVGSGGISISSNATMSYGYLQSGKIWKDLMQIVSCYRDPSVTEERRDLFSRNAIILTAFYFECLSNSLFGENDNSWKELTSTGEYAQLSKAVRKFIAKYNSEIGNDIDIDYKGVQDLFHVRNKVFAHAPESTTLSSNDPSQVTTLSYKKFSDLPSSYVEFKKEHADLLLSEVNSFLVEYTSSMKNVLPNWWVENYG